MKEIMGRKYNEKQVILLEMIGKLICERDKDKKILSDTEENREFLKNMYDKKIELLNEMVEEMK